VSDNRLQLQLDKTGNTNRFVDEYDVMCRNTFSGREKT